MTTSKVLPADASSRTDFPVIVLTIFEFAPLSAAATVAVIVQASDPYVRTLHTHALYRRMRRFTCRVPSFHTFLSLPNRCVAMAILRRTSAMSPPPASKIEPRYLNYHVLLASCSSHFTFGSWSCIAFLFCRIVSTAAVAVIFARCSS